MLMDTSMMRFAEGSHGIKINVITYYYVLNKYELGICTVMRRVCGLQ